MNTTKVPHCTIQFVKISVSYFALIAFLLISQTTDAQLVVINDTPGSSSFTVPPCITQITVEVYGGGGGGGGSDSPTIGGGGGAAGGYSTATFIVVPGTVIPFVVGDKGLGGGPAGDGINGGISSWNGGVLFANGGTGGLSENNGGGGGAGGNASGWATNITGGNGGNGNNPFGGNGADNTGPSGGLGGPGGSAGLDGSNGSNYGACGGGGGKRFAGITTSGGSGAVGAIIIRYGIVYTTIANGNWSATGTWDANGVPPNPLPCGATIIINNSITYDVTQDILGTLIVNIGASLIGPTQDLNIGQGGINQGEFINYGTVVVDNLDVEPDGCLTPPDPYPVCYNYGTITAIDQIDIGEDCGSGSFYNQPGGTVYADELDVEGYLCNQDSMFITSEVQIDGGLIDCCGFIETPFIELEENDFGLPGTSNCQVYCTALGGSPTIEIDGTVYTLAEVYLDPDPDEGIVNLLTTFCDPIVLGVELVFFEANIDNNNDVLLSWETVNEKNCDYFIIERSTDALNWKQIAKVDGAGNSTNSISYEELDKSPLLGVSYYRLRQVDYNGQFNLYGPVSINLYGNSVFVYPNPAANVLYIECRSDIKFNLWNMQGQRVISTQITEGHNRIELDEISTGAYYYTIENKYSVSRGRIIIKR